MPECPRPHCHAEPPSSSVGELSLVGHAAAVVALALLITQEGGPMPSTRTNLSPYDASGHWRGVKAVPSDVETTQRGLATALRANSPRSGVPHVLIALPSFSAGESLLEHYGDRIPSLEHRYLLAMTMLGRLESCEQVFVCSVAPSEEVL